MHATGLPIEVRLTVFSTGADRLKVFSAVSANAFLEFGHMSFSIHAYYNARMPLVIRAEITSLVHDLPEPSQIFKRA